MKQTIAQLGWQALEGTRLDRPKLLYLASLAGAEPHELMYWARQVRTKHFGNAVAICSIIPGKAGGCGEDCKWCAQSGHSHAAASAPQRTEPAGLQQAARSAALNQAGCFCIVNSGRRPTERDLDEVCAAATEIRRTNPNSQMHVSASLGEITPAQATRLAQAGVHRYNHNLETSRRMFGQVVTTHTYEDRIATLAAARDAGMELCCGGIFGLGETWEDRIDLALTLRNEIKPVMSPLNFLHPIPGTAMAGQTPLAPMEILAVIAIFRLAMPTVDLKIAGGRHLNLRDLQSWIFYAGATSCLVGNYLTTSGRSAEQDLQMFKDLGLEVVADLPKPVEGASEEP